MGSSPNNFQEWLRRGAKWLLGSVVLAILLLMALVTSLRLPRVRVEILRWAGSAVKESTGIHPEAQDFALSLRTGEISLYDLVLRANGSESEPFLVVPAIEAQLSWSSLLSDRPQIHSVLLQEPKLDLGAPLPRGSEEDEADARTLFPSLDIHGFELLDGSVRSGEAPSDLDMWWDSWRVDPLTLGGSLMAGELTLQIQDTGISVNSHRRPEMSTALDAQLSVAEDGDFTIDSLRLSGDALHLQADGHGRMGAGTPIVLSMDLRSDLSRLFLGLVKSNFNNYISKSLNL